MSKPIKTRPNGKAENFDLVLTRPATVRGKVVAKGERAVVGLEVRAQAADLCENRYYDPTTQVNEDGSFELKFIRPGKQHIQVSPFWFDVAEAPEGSSVTLDLAAGEVREAVELTAVSSSREQPSAALAQRTFRVLITDAAGKPQAKQPVLVTTLQSREEEHSGIEAVFLRAGWGCQRPFQPAGKTFDHPAGVHDRRPGDCRDTRQRAFRRAGDYRHGRCHRRPAKHRRNRLPPR